MSLSDDETRQAVARAICVACDENPDAMGDARGNEFRWQDYLDTADAAIAAHDENLRKQDPVAQSHVENLATLVNRLCRKLSKVDPTDTVRISASDYLYRHNLIGTSLRKDDEGIEVLLDIIYAAPQPPTPSQQEAQPTTYCETDAALARRAAWEQEMREDAFGGKL